MVTPNSSWPGETGAPPKIEDGEGLKGPQVRHVGDDIVEAVELLKLHQPHRHVVGHPHEPVARDIWTKGVNRVVRE